MRTIHLLGLEPIETRYTKQWHTEVKKILSNDFNVVQYDGELVSNKVQAASDFLNWTATNVWKSTQLVEFIKNINNVKDNDIVLITDFWNPCVIQIKYIFEMSNIKAKIVGIAHAGLYDPNDQLSQRVGHAWAKQAESSIAHCYDQIFVGTTYHEKIFLKAHKVNVKVVGYPFDYIEQDMSTFYSKEKLILFCQRNAPEKQPLLFEELSKNERFKDYTFLDISKESLTKEEYYDYLKRAKYVISFAKQETLGITPFEALAFGCNILVPDRLSYHEMYSKDVRYDTYVKTDLESCVSKLDEHINKFSLKYQRKLIEENFNYIKSKFFSSTSMIQELKNV